MVTASVVVKVFIKCYRLVARSGGGGSAQRLAALTVLGGAAFLALAAVGLWGQQGRQAHRADKPEEATMEETISACIIFAGLV